jgi:carbamate kinase
MMSVRQVSLAKNHCVNMLASKTARGLRSFARQTAPGSCQGAWESASPFLRFGEVRKPPDGDQQQCRCYHDPSKEHIVIALGGNALLRRKERMTMENQRLNIREGIRSLAPIVQNNTVTLVHGNGPQVGLLVLEGAEYEKQTGLEQMRLDVLDAETEGMIGYMIEQELHPYLDADRPLATLLTQIVVDPTDPAFQNPTKFIGPVYSKEESDALSLPVRRDGEHWRRVVASPLPVRLLRNQLHSIRALVQEDCVVICAGGGGIPITEDPETGHLTGIEAVIDKDRAACLVGTSLKATGLLILTDVPGVAVGYGSKDEKWIKQVSPNKLKSLKRYRICSADQWMGCHRIFKGSG